ncbi:UNVERIFIED_CONTAM: protein DMR6-LIKE OXYGENASE 2 [Sesamum calycinum]|uniref:Protein DMR6-LIKE OXYGENASE 2 n=1 Tax=Sesamum calycinum TaxID=2727403 RepID=A0AAW2SEV9_9LAMI
MIPARQMEKLISSKHNIQHVPESYILPPEIRPRKVAIHSCKCVPVIDLHGNIDRNRQDLVQRIMKAGQEFGFFQLTNHGVPEELMKETVKVAEEFFQLPVEDMASFYSEDPRKECRLYTSIDYDHEKVHFWRDNLRHLCHPLEDHVGEWPRNPTRYREVMGNYAVRVRELCLMLLDLICEGLGIESGYFEGGLGKVQILSLNYYPPCPDPALTLGLPKHADPNLITVLNQGAVPGLQVLIDEEWLALEPVPNAFVVNIGHALQVISNGMLRCAEHRVVTNAYVARTTVTSFIQPSNDSLIQPAALLVDRCSLPLYRAFPYDEFVRKFIKDTRDGEPTMKEYQISKT